MPRRLSALPRSRLRQGSRRVEPNGALLQLHSPAQHPGPRTIYGTHRKSPLLASTSTSSPLKPHSDSSARRFHIPPAFPRRSLSPNRLTEVLAQPRRANQFDKSEIA